MTVSKTTTRGKVRDFVRSKDYSVSVKEYAEFADSLTAELQKENARLRMVFEEAIILVEEGAYSKALKLMRIEARECWRADPPKGGAVPKGLSKEKAK